MKKLFLAFIFLASTNIYAATEAQSVRSSNSFVSKGDSQGNMIQTLGNPESSYEYKTRDANGRLAFATDYRYTIDSVRYTLTVIGGVITRIVWER